MSTRSYIGYVTESGKVKYVYCHFDGYPSGVGSTLIKYYTDPKTIAKLISMGGISSLEAKIGRKHPFDSRNNDKPENEKQTTFYHRDRGEELDVYEADSPEAYLADFRKPGDWCEFAYLWRDNTWYVAEISGFMASRPTRDFEPVAEAILRIEEARRTGGDA